MTLQFIDEIKPRPQAKIIYNNFFDFVKLIKGDLNE